KAHHSGGLRGTADCGRNAERGGRAGATNRNWDRTHCTAQEWKRISDRDYVESPGKRGGNVGNSSDTGHQRAQGRGKPSGPDGGQVPRAARSGARCHGGGEPGRRDCPVERASGETVWV